MSYAPKQEARPTWLSLRGVFLGTTSMQATICAANLANTMAVQRAVTALKAKQDQIDRMTWGGG